MQLLAEKAVPKERRNFTLDADLAAWLDASENASATVNTIIRAARQAQEEHDALVQLVNDLEETTGPADPDDVAYFLALMGVSQ